MNKHNFISLKKASELEAYFNQFTKIVQRENFYSGYSDHGTCNYWLFNEMETILNTVLFEFHVSQNTVIEDEIKSDNQYLALFIWESNVYFKGHCIGEGENVKSILFKKGDEIKLDLKENEHIKGIACSFSDRLLHHVLKEDALYFSNLFDDKPYLFHTMNQEMEHCIREIFSLQIDIPGKFGFKSSKIIELITHFLVNINQRRKESKEKYLTIDVREEMLEVKKMIISNLMEPPTLKELSREFGISIPKLRKTFRSVYGLTPHQFLIRERLFKTRRKVFTTSLSMSEISDLLGFADSSHFTKLYKKEFGNAPLRERKIQHCKIA
ncbi:helix-turn-helix domain-containing protein [Flammeovirga yaeyamensis]|uniref:Helix-turn-helix domain-containing protein n=1 Tax=Flammeovirga yaeyamensis TaxID=367791 RepID=A0AAX1NEC2_9BACT|nr:AraC family transcriptional regulator [Flammeovirga yaeyamensis]MBB3699440.1 AraC-like DNA-binding protein [Flammeovirga yaeyamensis]NMF35303.1 helix-turn-helix transcriptional regulator [Flammeovirga yaeyamensis]QWG04163.1 helix-turn-helix domain-containing protein [Flammeovirga yaeyamensis]